MQLIEFGFEHGSISEVFQLVRNSLDTDYKEYTSGNRIYFTTHNNNVEITTIVEASTQKSTPTFLYIIITSSCIATLANILYTIRNLQLHSNINIVK